MNMRFTITFLLLVISLQFNAQTFVPDDNFEQALINLGLDSGALDDMVPTANINTVTSLNVFNKNITDLTGIEDFAALEVLSCGRNQLTALDVSQNTNLITLRCNENQIASLNISGLTNLEEIVVFDNNLSVLDISTNTALIKLNGGFNPYTTLDFSNNPNMEFIGSPMGSLTSLNLTGTTALQELYLGDNSITTIDISGKPNLQFAEVNDNNLTSIITTGDAALQFLRAQNNNLPSLEITTLTSLILLDARNNNLTELNTGNLSFTNINVSQNNITSLDFSQNGSLQFVRVQDNNLNELNMVNGNNTGIISSGFDARNNSSLLCIQVDDAAYSTNNWNNVDSQTTFNETCTFSVGDLNSFSFSTYPNPAINELHIAANFNANYSYMIYDISGKLIQKNVSESDTIIDVSTLQSGLYLIQIETETHQKSIQKFIKN